MLICATKGVYRKDQNESTTMSDFVPRDILPDLWEEILRRHWTFLETEESMQKLEERKKLEGCLKEFLCVAQHDRKFFLPETAHVLKKTVRDLKDFNAFKAMIGFESISQYANNLFTKPWRKEYRIIKMYSGFYQHEIKSNLVDAEKLFEAMGYRQLPNQILVLDGPICPDQVTNVSRDAMAAYVECQIMKQIKAGLTAVPIACSWLDVFKYRESHLGGATQAIKAMAYAEQERRYRHKKLPPEPQYAAPVQTPSVITVGAQTVPSCDNCGHHNSYRHPPHGPGSGHHQVSNNCNMRPISNYSCNLHHVNNAVHCKHPNYSQMSHSKSLEHYNDHTDGPLLPHRHSFDQPQKNSQHIYDNPYDCVEDYQNACNFNTYNHPYNVSGNRYPLPYNISNQLNHNQYIYNNTGGVYHGAAGCGHKLPTTVAAMDSTGYGECNGYAKINPCSYSHVQSRTSGAMKDFQNYRQRSFPPDHQLIDFDEHPTHDIAHSYSRLQSNSFDHNDRTPHLYDNRRSRAPMQLTNQASTQKDIHSRNHSHVDSSDDLDGNYVYATPSPGRQRKPVTEKYLKNKEILQEYEKMLDNKKLLPEVPTRSSDTVHASHIPHAHPDNYDSFDDFVNIEHAKNIGEPSLEKTSRTKKNQDGVGSFESWDYVFQNLEKHGYSKDLGERDDLLVQSLDLDSMNISASNTASVEKRRQSRNLEVKPRGQNGEAAKSKSLEKTSTSTRPKPHTEKSILRNQSNNSENEQSSSTLKPTLKSNLKHSTNLNNNFEDAINQHQHLHSTDRPAANRLSSSSSRSPLLSGHSNSNSISGNITQTIVTSPTEWSCRFCTFLNPETNRVCEMCSKSKDFNLESTNTPTCV